MRALVLLLALASVSASAQTACAADGSPACVAFRALTGAALATDAPADSATALRHADAVLRSAPADTLADLDSVAAVGWQVGAERRVVAVNTSGEPAFVELAGVGVPAPLVAVYVSRADAGPVPSLVMLLDDDRTAYGLRVPPRSAVVWGPASAADVRPGGLDE